MERFYTILLDKEGRSPNRPLRRGLDLGVRLDAGAHVTAEPPRPALHRERLTASELLELTREPDFVAAAEIMCTRRLSPAHLAPVVQNRSAPGELRRGQSWGIAAIGADRSRYTGADVTVALLDTGIEAEHSAFRGIELAERDFTGSGNGDSDGHGTHCAGILFGRNVEGIRIGVAPGVSKALIGKVLERGKGDSDMLARGVVWAHEAGARVISMSVGLDFAGTVEDRRAHGWDRDLAIAAALEAYQANIQLLNRLLSMLRLQEPFTGGAIVVAAAGDDSRRGTDGDQIMSASPPAGAERIVSVGSLDPDPLGAGYQVSGFSNTGVEISAPGAGIVSAGLGGGLVARSGTSAAAPHVAGVAALWWQAVRQSDLPANATVVRSKLIESAERNSLSPAIHPGESGAGCATAPQDRPMAAGVASADRRGPSRTAPRQFNSIAGRARRPVADFSPISIDFDLSHAQAPRRRRNLC